MGEFALKNVKVVTHKEVFDAGIFIENGKIAQILRKGDVLKVELKKYLVKNRCKIIDLKGKYLLPGLIDVHVHFRTPGMTKKEDWTSGSKAALAGGVTTVLDMPNTLPPTIDARSLEKKRALVGKKALVNHGFYVGATSRNLQEIKKLKNTAGIKIFMARSTGDLLLEDKKDLERFMAEAKHLLAIHAESEQCVDQYSKKYEKYNRINIHSLIHTPECASEAVKEVLHLAKKYDARLHLCHVSSEKELNVIKKFKNENISVEVTPHHLFLTENDYRKYGNLVKVNPPLRGFADQVALWSAVKSGLIDIIATDHAPHLLAEKRLSYQNAPAGVPGVQTMLPLLLNAVNEGKLTLQRLVRLTSYNPARLFGIKNKGIVKVGMDADFSVVDMGISRKVSDNLLFSKCGWSPFTGQKLKGWPVMTFIAGELMYEWPDKFGIILGREVEFEK